jgi:acyl-CoA dehydrogenase
MTEPGTGSDLAAIKTTARRDGDDYVINGAKTFISNGQLCDLVIVAAKTGPGADPHKGISLFVVEADTPGLRQGQEAREDGHGLAGHQRAVLRGLPRAGRPTCSAAEGAGFIMLMQKLQQERLVVAIGGAGRCAEQVLKDTIAYTKERTAFGKPISKFQNTQFKLAECATEVEVGRVFLDRWSPSTWQGQVPGEGVLDGQAVAHRDAGARGRRAACSSSAATATCSSTRWRGRSWTRACSASTRAPARS